MLDESRDESDEPVVGLAEEYEEELPVDPVPGLIIEKADRSLAELHRWHQRGRLVLDPEWQRNRVWENKRKSRLIESILLDIPIPVIYLARDEQNSYDVIDGLQRLSSIFDFIDNRVRLTGLEMLRELNGKHFKDLDAASQRRIEDYTVRTFELAPQSNRDIMFLIFERLNTGGKPLNDMEIRNCLFRGPLNNLIKSLAEDTNFRRVLSQPNLSIRMSDRALVLRFLAFYEKTHLKATKGLKAFLHDFLKTYRHADERKLEEFERVFRSSMRASLTIFGERGFRLFRDDKSPGEWASRPNAAIFQAVATSFASRDLGQLTRRSDAIYEEYADLVATDEKWRDFVRRATGEATRLEYVFDTWNKRLVEALHDEGPNDVERCFSLSLKKQMFEQSAVCSICGNIIHLLDDAALDHDIHYWRGGKTVPENARLAHRLCNLKRPR